VLVRVTFGIVRYKRFTGGYHIIVHYAAMKKKGSGMAIFTTACEFSKIIWYMLRNGTLFYPQLMKDLKTQKFARRCKRSFQPPKRT